MAGRNIQGMAPQNYGQLNQANINKAIAQARLDSKQEALFKAISNVVQASAKDIYGDVTDKKTRYVVDLILKRIEGLLDAKGISSQQLQDTIGQAVNELLATTADKDQLEQLRRDIIDKTDGIEQKFETNAQTIEELKTLFGQQTGSKPQADAKSLKQDAFNKQTNFSKMLTSFGVDQVKNVEKLTGIVKALQTDISSTMKASQQVNVDKMVDIQKKIAAAQEYNTLLAEQLSQLQENITEAIDAQQKTFFKSFKLSFKGMFTAAMKGIWTVAKFSFKAAWKLVKGPLEALVVKPLKKAIRFAKDLIAAPFKLLTSTVSKIFNGLVKGTFNILAGFLSTPAGMFALGYGLGFIWKRWVQPMVEKIKYWFGPLIDLFDGKCTFKDAFATIWDRIKIDLWDNGIKLWLNEWFKNFSKAHETTTNVLQNIKEHPYLSGGALAAIISSPFLLKYYLKKKLLQNVVKGATTEALEKALAGKALQATTGQVAKEALTTGTLKIGEKVGNEFITKKSAQEIAEFITIAQQNGIKGISEQLVAAGFKDINKAQSTKKGVRLLKKIAIDILKTQEGQHLASISYLLRSTEHKILSNGIGIPLENFYAKSAEDIVAKTTKSGLGKFFTKEVFTAAGKSFMAGLPAFFYTMVPDFVQISEDMLEERHEADMFQCEIEMHNAARQAASEIIELPDNLTGTLDDLLQYTEEHYDELSKIATTKVIEQQTDEIKTIINESYDDILDGIAEILQKLSIIKPNQNYLLINGNEKQMTDIGI